MHTIFETDGPLAILTFNRPDARNAMTWEMYQALVDACDRVDQDADLRVFILRGAGGKAFVAGTDISQFQTFRDRDDGLKYEEKLDHVLDRLERVSKPTIAQVQGVAAGGGCAIALACDLRVATPESTFGIPISAHAGQVPLGRVMQPAGRPGRARRGERSACSPDDWCQGRSAGDRHGEPPRARRRDRGAPSRSWRQRSLRTLR
jgi:enoyl-CoA hydratase/carnithine racemase